MEFLRYDAELFFSLRAYGVTHIVPNFTRRWITECDQFECTITGPIHDLMPFAGEFTTVEPLGHMLCAAVWNCRRTNTEREVVLQNEEKFRVRSVPGEGVEQLHIKARFNRMPGQAHFTEFDVISYTGLVPTVHAKGTSIVRVSRPNEQLYLRNVNEVVQPPQRAEEEPRGPPEPPAEAQPHRAPSPPQQPPRQPSPVQEVPRPDSPEPVTLRSALRKNTGVGASAARRSVSFQNTLDIRVFVDQESYKFSYVNAHDLNPQIAAPLYLALADLDIVPKDVTFASMPTRNPETFIYSFSVDNRHDAQVIERMIVEGDDQFKLETLEHGQPFFFWEFSLRKLMKAVLLSHRYREESEAGGNLRTMIGAKEHLRAALGNREAVAEIRARLSRKGNGEWTKMAAEIAL